MNKTIKLAVLHYALGRFGGAAKIAILHSINLNRLGFQVELFYGGPIIDEWKKRACSEIQMNPLPLGVPTSVHNILKIRETIRILKSFDVVLISHVICPFLAYYLGKFLGSRLVWYCGEPLRALWEDQLSGISYKTLSCTVRPTSDAFYGKMLTSVFLSDALYDTSIKILRALDVRTTHSYRNIIANSHYIGEVIKKLYRLDQNVPIAYPGIDPKQYSQFNINHKPSDYILAVGAMIPMKNHINLLKAWHYLPPKCKPTLKLVIVGDGPLKGLVRSTIHKLGLKKVMIKASLSEDELACYYRNCRFIVHPAIYEPFGLVPLEAAFFGKTSIVSDLGGTKEFVIDGETGILVDPWNPKEIASVMMCLIDDVQLARKMGGKAQDRVLKEFTIEKSSKKIAAILNGRGAT